MQPNHAEPCQPKQVKPVTFRIAAPGAGTNAEAPWPRRLRRAAPDAGHIVTGARLALARRLLQRPRFGRRMALMGGQKMGGSDERLATAAVVAVALPLLRRAYSVVQLDRCGYHPGILKPLRL